MGRGSLQRQVLLKGGSHHGLQVRNTAPNLLVFVSRLVEAKYGIELHGSELFQWSGR
jgi:hypothetical protein